ncbi:putative glyoxalase superfamily protein PhnB [Knoellia remsis]|uniref:Putative glyoxalase superfamily protein PhnB n=1 Tax=Knoellia remsis TaxID=407159 RepID=A0A2T0TZD8_9MICO|nr:VOC family protein [Knoellia remsis]PRY50928.1 putative glyoxalase superfamily protein PhnB [Knoellia remsis]
MAELHPKLVVRGADAAIAFYEKAFGAVLTQRYTVGESVVFAELELLGGVMTLKDEDGTDRSPATLGGPGVVVEVTADDPDEVVSRAVDAGAEVRFPVADQPYGARGGRVRDPFGHEWLIQTAPTMTPEETQRAIDEAYG